MSAFYAVAYRDRVELLTDGAVYEDDGTLTNIRRKVWTSPRVPMAITGRGNNAAVERLAEAVLLIAALHGNFDDALRAADRSFSRYTKEGFPDPFEIVVAGISESRGPQIYYLATANVYGVDGIEPFRFYDAGPELGAGGGFGADELAAADITAERAASGLHDIGADLLEIMRRKPGPNPAKPDLPHVYGIGGHVDWTVVEAGGVRTERLREWPDVIGEKIDPFREMAEAA